MKKIKSVLSVLVVIAMMLITVPTASASSASIVARSNKTDVQNGDTVTVTVSLTSNPGMAGIDFTLTYNSAHLQYVSSAKGTAGSAFSMGSINQSGSSIRGAFLNADGSEANATGVLATVTFKVISSLTANSPLSLSGSGTDSSASVISVSANGVTLKLGEVTQAPTQTTTQKPTEKVTQNTTAKPTTTKAPTTKTESTTKTDESTTLVIATETIGVSKGNVYQLAKPSSMTGDIDYSSSNSSVATVTDTGVITTLAKGMTTIKAVSENGVTKTWLLIVGDGSTVEKETEETTSEEESTTILEVIGSVTEPEETEEETTAETDSEKKKDGADETFRLIFGTGAAVAVLIIIIIIASMIRKKRSFVG